MTALSFLLILVAATVVGMAGGLVFAAWRDLRARGARAGSRVAVG